MRLEQFIFCEIARQEISGQATLIGVLAGNQMNLGGGPPPGSGSAQIALPSFTIYAVFDYMTGITGLESQCEVMKDTQVIQRTAATKTDRRSNPKARFHSETFTFMPLMLPGFGDYMFKIMLKAEGKTLSFARRLTVQYDTKP